MQFGETFRVAFSSIRANKLRALLTTLGIIIGVAAVITMVALGTGAQRAVEAQINSLGANVFSVVPGQSFRMGVASDNRVALTVDDAAALQKDGTLLAGVVPEMSTNAQVKYLNKNLNVSILGATANFDEVRNYTLAHGRMFTAGEDAARQRYAVLGSSVPEQLGANPAALIGTQISIRGVPFEVIGVFQPKGSQGWQNPDEQILIPLNTARYRVMGTDRLRTIGIQVRDGIPVEQGMVDMERILRREHKIRPGGENDFSIRNPKDILATQEAATKILGALLLSIAGVSLIVGGIGIMNIMLVSVTERTKEIGIRKALGATKVNIMLQFLVESMVLCITGGAVGILLGTGLSYAVSSFMKWNTFVSPVAVAVSFGFSAAVGIIFGLLPAQKAAKLDPIVALRYE
ncbi:MAG: ABC transporter permease [Gemmatimonadales bacterium]|nr:ABC transporter permease [Gemmatimonadales bacterium]